MAEGLSWQKTFEVMPMAEDDIVQELESRYQEIARVHGLKTTLEEYENIYGLKDAIQKEGYVPLSLEIFIAGRITDIYYAWYNSMHSLIMPQPGSIYQMEESSFITEELREKIRKELRKIMSISRKAGKAYILKDSSLACNAVDEYTSLWKSSTRELLIEITTLLSERWDEEEKEEARSSYSY
jgi:hypothetical protein